MIAWKACLHVLALCFRRHASVGVGFVGDVLVPIWDGGGVGIWEGSSWLDENVAALSTQIFPTRVESQQVRSDNQIGDGRPVHGRVKLQFLVVVILRLPESTATGINTEGEDLFAIEVKTQQTVRCVQGTHGTFELVRWRRGLMTKSQRLCRE